jgi:hypothetical protein
MHCKSAVLLLRTLQKRPFNMKYHILIAAITGIFLTGFLPAAVIGQPDTIHHMSLNGLWEAGSARQYDTILEVPGLAYSPEKMNDDSLWYRKRLALPDGDWKYATVELKGARFNPMVYVNGEKVSFRKGGMAPTYHLLEHPDIKPGDSITLEIALASLNKVSRSNASYISPADHWRSNISSYLWDDVMLHTHRAYRFSRIIPHTRFDKNQVTIHCTIRELKKQDDQGESEPSEISDGSRDSLNVKAFLKNSLGDTLASTMQRTSRKKDTLLLNLPDTINEWSPRSPVIYDLELTLSDDEGITDSVSIPYGFKKFHTANKQFYLNNKREHLRAGTVCWHRWSREDTMARELLYDTQWFRKNVVKRLKDHGANTLRFHLGTPPERFLELCDRYGLMVQYEWHFFHGMKASKSSLTEQWTNWLDLAARHPSVVIIHPYNETSEDELPVAHEALDEILKDYPPVVLKKRDVNHIHKYWWSLFENLGLYHDSYKEFPKTIMVDEFGGNYLDGQWEPGGYPALKESFLRFLGRNHTVSERKYLHTNSNARVAEYWRRIGAAGFSPFVILGSYEDGNHWFLGDLNGGKPKPVWNALTAAWSPQSVSLEQWKQDFLPGDTISSTLYFFNDFNTKDTLKAKIRVKNMQNQTSYDTFVYQRLGPNQSIKKKVEIPLPQDTGHYKIEAELINKPASVRYPVVSSWDIHVMKPVIPKALNKLRISTLDNDSTMKSFLMGNRLNLASPGISDIIMLSQPTWQKIAGRDSQTLEMIANYINEGKSVIFLDAGPRSLGINYPRKDKKNNLLAANRNIEDPEQDTVHLPLGLKAVFKQRAEAESHIHPSRNNSALWNNLKPQHTWLWNGYRGGLIAPAQNMEITGLKQEAFARQWTNRGADTATLKSGDYYAYELQNHYKFFDQPEDQDTIGALREKVKFLVQDAPALANAINPEAPVHEVNLHERYLQSKNAQAEKFTPLASAGKNLTMNPVVKVSFGEGKGNLIISQLFTQKRILPENKNNILYRPSFDPAAKQFVYNIMVEAVKE